PGARTDLAFKMAKINGPAVVFQQAVILQFNAAQSRDVVEERIRRLGTQNLIALLREQLETIPIGDARSRRDDDLFGGNLQRSVVPRNRLACNTLPQGVWSVNARGLGCRIQDVLQDVRWIDNSVLVDVAANEIHNVPALGLQPVMEYIERVLWTAQLGG